MRQVVAALMLAAALASPRAAFAQAGARVTVVRPARPSHLVAEATTRLEAELRGAGFDVQEVDARPELDARGQVEATPKDGPSSIATIAILDTGGAAVADVWVADTITQKTLVRRVSTQDPEARTAASDLAVRSVELLRASLLEVAPKRDLPAPLPSFLDATSKPPAPPPPVLAAPAPLPRVVAAPRRVVTVSAAPPRRAPPPDLRDRVGTAELAVGVLASPGYGTAFTPASLRLAIALPRGFGLRASITDALSLTRSATAGSASISQWFAAFDATYAIGRDKERLVPILSIGGGVHHLDAQGSAAPGFSASDQSFLGAFVSAGAGIDVRVSEGVSVLADVSALLLQPEPSVTIGGAVVFATGRPAIAASIGPVVHW